MCADIREHTEGRYPKQQKAPMGYGMLCPNSSFVGMPINAALYGSLGIIYTALLEIPMNLTMWTVGLGMFTSTDHRSAVKKVLLHPCIIAVFLGLISMFLSLTLPAVLDSAVLSVGQCATPLSMIVIGATLADADFKMIFSRRVLWLSLLRLLLFPLAVYAVLSLLPLDPVLVAITVIVTGTPAGSTTSILAEQYDCGSEFASQIVFSTTLLSMVTLPLLCLIL